MTEADSLVFDQPDSHGHHRRGPKPTANAQSVTTSEDAAAFVTLTGTPPSGNSEPLSYAIATQPSNGTLANLDPATGVAIYIPSPGYTGPDSFTFTVSYAIERRSPGFSRRIARPSSATRRRSRSQSLPPTRPRVAGHVPTSTVLYQSLVVQDQYAPPVIDVPGVPSVLDDGTVPGSQNTQADSSGNVPTTGDMSPLDIPQAQPWSGGSGGSMTQVLSTGFIVSPTATFVPADIGNYSSTTPASTTTTPTWTDAQGITHTASVSCQSTLTIAATADGSGDWTYDESLSETWLVSVTSPDDTNSTETDTYGYTFVSSGGPNGSTFTFTSTASASAAGSCDEVWNTDSGNGAAIYAWTYTASYDPTISNTTNSSAGTATGTVSGSGNTAWSGFGAGTYSDSSFRHGERNAYPRCH